MVKDKGGTRRDRPGAGGRKVLRGVGMGIAAVLLAGVVAANVAVIMFGESLDVIMSADEVNVSDADVDAQLARDTKLAETIEGEGLVLLANRENDQGKPTLPLDDSVSRVNVFGWASTQWVVGGSGSGGVAGGGDGILEALTNQGIAYNQELEQMYRGFLDERPLVDTGTLNSPDTLFCRLYEPAIEDEKYYSAELLRNAKEYSDTAIVVLGRMAGESIDCPREQLRVTTKGGEVQQAAGRSYLSTSPEEDGLIRYVAANYKNVIVLVNSTNAMELGIVDEVEGVDACMLVGATGTSSASAVVKALWGEVNPSGRTTDTYAYDLATAASWANAGALGEGSYLGSEGLYPADGTKNSNVGTDETYSTVRFVDYVEGIYVGYRWYETADAEGFWNDVSNRYGDGYDGVVQYPFGYGLSYTDFDWRVVGRSARDGAALRADDTVSVTVRVTNVGVRPGKDVVELYATAPYTPGGIEKASTELVAFGKTGELAPGQSEDLTLEFAARDMASYDALDANGNGFCGYELEAGEYRVELKRDAHTLAPCEGASVGYRVASDIRYETDAVTGAEVTNRFTGAAGEKGISLDGSTTEGAAVGGAVAMGPMEGGDSEGDVMAGGIAYLSRADFEGTFPRERDADRAMSERVADLNLYDADDAAEDDAAASEALESGDYGAQQGAPAKATDRYDVARDGELTPLGRQLGESFDDPMWDVLLDQLSTKDMERLVLHGYSNSAALDAIAKPKTKELDGSSQAASFNQLRWGVGFCNPTTIAQTWNTGLAREFGRAAGMECAMLGIDGWYAPACNMHRTPLGGRNYEYYSEDPLISGDFAAETVRGAKETGTFTYLKHLVLNEQDSYRDSLYTWLPEQALREIYLEPFRIAVQQGGATGIMSSYNRIGAVWAGGSRALLIDVLRGEWGFSGSVITDYSDHHAYMNAEQSLRAGGSLYMDGVFRDGKFRFGTDSASYYANLRRASKEVIYVWLNARATNLAYNEAAASAGDGAGTATLVRPIKTSHTSPLKVGLAVVDAVAAIGAVMLVHGVVSRRRR